MTINIRPSIIIGLGRTGHWIATYIKQQVMCVQKDELARVRLLVIDSGNEKEPTTGEEVISSISDQMKLNPEEIMYLYEQPDPLVHRAGKDLPGETRLSSWFEELNSFKNQSSIQQKLGNGAGQIRQIGRMALFNDLNRGFNKIYEALENLINNCELGKNENLQVMVVGSLAGGTGSGLFFDIGYMIKWIAHAQNIPLQLLGFFVLPNSFENKKVLIDFLMNVFVFTCLVGYPS